MINSSVLTARCAHTVNLHGQLCSSLERPSLEMGDWTALMAGVVCDSPNYPAGASMFEIDLAAMRHGLVDGAEEFLRNAMQLRLEPKQKRRSSRRAGSSLMDLDAAEQFFGVPVGPGRAISLAREQNKQRTLRGA